MPPLHALTISILRPASVLLRRNVLRNAIATNRPFSITSTTFARQLPPRRVILDDEIEENFLRGTGPGGQKINKTSCAVQLKHHATGIVVKCQETRSRSQNRKIARKILGERIEEVELGDQSRTAVKARERSKKKASADKKKRRKYKELAEAKEGENSEGINEGIAEEGVRNNEGHDNAEVAGPGVMPSAKGG